MPERAGWRRRAPVLFWRVVNPPTRPLAGAVPWWVLLETTGRKTGRPRHTPLATGPHDDDGMWLLAVHGRHAGWVRNIEAEPAVRLRHRGRWRSGTTSVHPFDRELAARFNRYARSGPSVVGLDPLQVYVRWTDV